MNAIELAIEGIGIWGGGMRDWPSGREILLHGAPPGDAFAKPAPSLLPPTERRRAPETVLLAIEAAQQACVMAKREPRTLPNVFASGYGELAISDYLCATLARAPLEVSPTRFHNSVHNAAAGYWTIATGCMESSTAVSAGAATFGAGLLEAAVRVAVDGRATLFVAYDAAAAGPLVDVVPSRAPFAVGLVLAPPSPQAIARLTARTGRADLAPEADVLHPFLRDNPAARSLALLRALASGKAASLRVPAGTEFDLHLEIMP
ncbi:MAG TPA: beta-ketoacyl synthase chain length factor [Rudaea sp.]|nr:beta-ketoacyl synthase chain length factor [Rudaea sp.]